MLHWSYWIKFSAPVLQGAVSRESREHTPMLAKAVVALALLAQAARAKDFRVQFNVETTSGPGSFIVRVHEDWAPIGAARFKEAVEAGFYDDTRTLRAPTLFLGRLSCEWACDGQAFSA